MRALFNIKRINPTHEERSCEFFHWKIAHDLHEQCIFAIFSHIKEMKCGEGTLPQTAQIYFLVQRRLVSRELRDSLWSNKDLIKILD